MYRQVGIGCERLFRQVLGDALGLTQDDTEWSYTISNPDGTRRRLSLDARIPIERIPDDADRRRVRTWMLEAAAALGVDRGIAESLSGIVFEVRQGYKSKDSKRQNADIANASAAYTRSCLPCVLLLSQQMDADVLQRYRLHRWTVLTGTLGADDPGVSTYDFMREVVGFDLAAFFARHAKTLQREVRAVLESLLSPGSGDDSR